MKSNLLLCAACVAVFSCSRSSSSEDQLDEVVEATPVLKISAFDVPLLGKVSWNAEVRSTGLTDSLQFKAEGVDPGGVFHQLTGTVPIQGRGQWTGSAWRFEHQEDVLGGRVFGKLRHNVWQVVAGSQTLISNQSLIPVALDFEITEAGTRIEGKMTLHPSTETLYSQGRETALEKLVLINGTIGYRNCTVFSREPAAPGVPAIEQIVDATDPACDERFLGPQ